MPLLCLINLTERSLSKDHGTISSLLGGLVHFLLVEIVEASVDLGGPELLYPHFELHKALIKRSTGSAGEIEDALEEF